MQQQKFKFRRVKVNPKDLVQHHVIEIIGDEIPDAFIIGEAKYFGHLNIPVITAEMSILTNIKDVLLAVAMNLKEIEVCIIEGLEDGEVIRFLNYKGIFLNLSYDKVLALFDLVQAYYDEKQRGKDWVNSMPGIDTRSRIAYVFGYRSGSIVAMLRSIQKYCPELFERMSPNKHREEGKITIQKAYKMAVEKRKRIKEAEAQINNSKSTSNETPPAEATVTSNDSGFSDPNDTGSQTIAISHMTPVPEFEGIKEAINRLVIQQSKDGFHMTQSCSNKLDLHFQYTSHQYTNYYTITEKKIESEAEIDKQFSIKIVVSNLDRLGNQ